jgi:hypothetical protein
MHEIVVPDIKRRNFLSNYTFKLFSSAAAPFMKKGGLMLYSTLALGVLLAGAPAYASGYVSGQNCNEFGATHLADDRTDVLACLQQTSGSTAQSDLVWKVQYSGNNGGYFTVQSDSIPDAMPITATASPTGQNNCVQSNPITGYCNCAVGYSPVAISQNQPPPMSCVDPACTNTVNFSCIQAPGTPAASYGQWRTASSAYWTGGVQCITTGGVGVPDGGTASDAITPPAGDFFGAPCIVGSPPVTTRAFYPSLGACASPPAPNDQPYYPMFESTLTCQ